MATKEEVQEFVNSKTVAVVGVSRTDLKFGNTIYKELKQKGYHVVPVNPNIPTFDDRPCYPSLTDVTEDVEAAVVCVPPVEATKVVQDASKAGIQKVWLQQGCGSEEAIQLAEQNGLQVIRGHCILMFVEPRSHIHSFHFWLWKLLGKLPK